MKILYISTVCSRKKYKDLSSISDKELYPSIQNFHLAILNGISANKNDITVFSGLTISGTSISSINKFKHEKENNINFYYPFFGKNNEIKKILVAIQLIIFMIFWSVKNIFSKKAIIVDSAYISLSPLALLLSKLFFITIGTIVADIYEYTSDKIQVQKTRGIKEKVSCIISNFCWNNYDFFVLLTEKMNEIVNSKNKPYIVMEGIIDFNNFDLKISKKANKKKVFMYAGSLFEKYGLKTYIEAFKKIDKNKAELWIFGKGELEEYINTNVSNNIKFFGSKPISEILKYERKADILINPRFSDEEYTLYSFPSKILEYMASGTPVLTTRLSGIPKEYNEHLYFFEEENLEGFYKTTKEIISIKDNELIEKGNIAKEFVLKAKNNKYQTKKIVELIAKAKIEKKFFSNTIEKALLMILGYLSIVPEASNRYAFLGTVISIALLEFYKNRKNVFDFLNKNILFVGSLVLWLLLYLTYWILGNANLLPMYIFTYLRIAITIFISIYYLKDGNTSIFKTITNFAMITICVVNIYTIYSNIMHYNLSRILSTYIKPNINTFGIGSYTYVYGLTFLMIPLFYYFKSTQSKIVKALTLFTIVTSLLTIIKTEFLISIILLVFGMLMYIFKVDNMKKFLVTLIVISILGIVTAKPISMVCNNVSNKIDSYNLSLRFKDISYFLDGHLEKTTDLKLRLEVYNKSINTFLKSPIFGVGFNGNEEEIYMVGKHSTTLDELAQYGIVGSSPLFAMLIISMIKIEEYIKNKDAKKSFFISSLLYMIFIFFNTGLFVTNIYFLFLLVPFVLNLSEQKN